MILLPCLQLFQHGDPLWFTDRNFLQKLGFDPEDFWCGKIEYKLTETNIAPENRPLEKEIPNLETIILRGENVGFREGRSPKLYLLRLKARIVSRYIPQV